MAFWCLAAATSGIAYCRWTPSIWMNREKSHMQMSWWRGFYQMSPAVTRHTFNLCSRTHSTNEIVECRLSGSSITLWQILTPIKIIYFCPIHSDPCPTKVKWHCQRFNRLLLANTVVKYQLMHHHSTPASQPVILKLSVSTIYALCLSLSPTRWNIFIVNVLLSGLTLS